MTQKRTSVTAAIIGLTALALLATPSVAGGTHGSMGAGAPVQTTPMGQGYGPGMMGSGMMGPGMMGTAAFGDGHCSSATGVVGDLNLSTDDVRTHLEQSLKWHGNTRLTVGDVTETDDDTITAEIVTVDDSLVQRMMIDRHTGQMRSVE